MVAGSCDGAQERQDGLEGVKMTHSRLALHPVQTHGAEWTGREDGVPPGEDRAQS